MSTKETERSIDRNTIIEVRKVYWNRYKPTTVNNFSKRIPKETKKNYGEQPHRTILPTDDRNNLIKLSKNIIHDIQVENQIENWENDRLQE